MSDNKKMLAFAGRYWERLIPEDKEIRDGRGKQYVLWGDDNAYPQYLHKLYDEVAILKGIIDSTADYVCGDGVLLNGGDKVINPKGLTVTELTRQLAKDYLLYGGFALQAVRNQIGGVAALYPLDYRCVRVNEDLTVAWYSEEFDRKWARADKTVRYPIFSDISSDAVSVFYYSNSNLRTYPVPVWSGAIRACEMQREIDKFHLSSIRNGFAGSALISFNNGVPTDEQREQIEKDINEKFCGGDEAGSVLISFSDGKDNALTVEKLDYQDFGDKHKAASDRSREEIFASFRCSPLLVGLSTIVNTGFSTQEFKDTFKLYSRTVVKPIQDRLSWALGLVTGDESIEMKPFTIDFGNTQE